MSSLPRVQSAARLRRLPPRAAGWNTCDDTLPLSVENNGNGDETKHVRARSTNRQRVSRESFCDRVRNSVSNCNNGQGYAAMIRFITDRNTGKKHLGFHCNQKISSQSMYTCPTCSYENQVNERSRFNTDNYFRAETINTLLHDNDVKECTIGQCRIIKSYPNIITVEFQKCCAGKLHSISPEMMERIRQFCDSTVVSETTAHSTEGEPDKEKEVEEESDSENKRTMSVCSAD